MKTHTPPSVFAAVARRPRAAVFVASLLTVAAGASVYYWNGNSSGTGCGAAGAWDLHFSFFRPGPAPATYAAGLGLATLCFVGVREWWSRRCPRC